MSKTRIWILNCLVVIIALAMTYVLSLFAGTPHPVDAKPPAPITSTTDSPKMAK